MGSRQSVHFDTTSSFLPVPAPSDGVCTAVITNNTSFLTSTDQAAPKKIIKSRNKETRWVERGRTRDGNPAVIVATICCILAPIQSTSSDGYISGSILHIYAYAIIALKRSLLCDLFSLTTWRSHTKDIR